MTFVSGAFELLTNNRKSLSGNKNTNKHLKERKSNTFVQMRGVSYEERGLALLSWVLLLEVVLVPVQEGSILKINKYLGPRVAFQ